MKEDQQSKDRSMNMERCQDISKWKDALDSNYRKIAYREQVVSFLSSIDFDDDKDNHRWFNVQNRVLKLLAGLLLCIITGPCGSVYAFNSAFIATTF